MPIMILLTEIAQSRFHQRPERKLIQKVTNVRGQAAPGTATIVKLTASPQDSRVWLDSLDHRLSRWQDRTMRIADEAIAKLEGLSQERASRVFSLIEDLAELEELEDAVDLKVAGEALADAEPVFPHQQLRREVGLDR